MVPISVFICKNLESYRIPVLTSSILLKNFKAKNQIYTNSQLKKPVFIKKASHGPNLLLNLKKNEIS